MTKIMLKPTCFCFGEEQPVIAYDSTKGNPNVREYCTIDCGCRYDCMKCGKRFKE